MTDDNSNPDTAEAKINLLFDSYADGDISADEAKKQLKGLLVDAQIQQLQKLSDNGIIGQWDADRVILALQQTRQEEK